MKYLIKTIEYGLYLLVFILPWQTRWLIKPGQLNGGYWEYGTISLYGTDVLLILLLILFTIYKLGTVNFRFWILDFGFNSKFWFFIIGLALMLFASLFFAPDKTLAVFSYARFLLGVGLFWLVLAAGYDYLKLILSFLAGLALQAGLGIWQFLSQSSFASKWLGLAFHDAAAPGTSVVEVYRAGELPERWLRAYGGLDHPNVLGGLLAIGLILIVWLIINGYSRDSQIYFVSRTPLHNSKFQVSSFKFYFLLPTSYFLLLTSLFFTFSRGAWAGAIVGLVAMLIAVTYGSRETSPTGNLPPPLNPSYPPLWKKGRDNIPLPLRKGWLGWVLPLEPPQMRGRQGERKEKLLNLLKIIGAGAALIVILFFSYKDLVLTRLSVDTRLEEKSKIERLESYKNFWRLTKGHWLFGQGLGNYTLTEALADKKNAAAWLYQPAHNTFILVWGEGGLLALIFFIGLLVYIFYSGCRRRREEADKMAKTATAIVLIPLLITMMLVDHWYWSLHFGVLFFWFIMGIVVREEKENMS